MPFIKDIMEAVLKIEKGKLLKEISSFDIGGPAELYVEAKSCKVMQEALRFAKRVSLPYRVVGRGTNLLFDSKGFRGLVIHNKIDTFEIHGRLLRVGSGFPLPRLAMICAKMDLAGIELCGTVPGSIGGAVYMNASAYGQAISDHLTKVLFYGEDEKEIFLEKEKLQFGYRFSSFQMLKGVILEAFFELAAGDKIREKLFSTIEDRKKKQPLAAKSAGCVFRNPESGNSAGKLIEMCGLKGFRIGEAVVSQLHANFIINDGQANSDDVLDLITHVRKAVKAKEGIDLECEIEYIPYFG